MSSVIRACTSLMLALCLMNNAKAEEIFPRIFAGGVSGSNALVEPGNSDAFRAAGGGLYAHAIGWDRLSEAEKNAALATFYGSDKVVEVGFSTSQADWYRSRFHAKGVRAKIVTINAFSSNRVPTVSGWNDLLSYYRAIGIDARTDLFATFEYQNFSTNISTLSNNEVSDRPDFQQIIAMSRGLALDVPAKYYFDREQAYRNWVIDAIRWAQLHHFTVMMIASPHNSGTNFHNDLREFVSALQAADAVPNVISVENYSVADPATYPNVVGNEDTPYHQLGAARLLQTQYAPAWVGRTNDKDGDAKPASEEPSLARSDTDPSDTAFDFGSAGNLEGWTAVNVTGLSIGTGILTGTTATADPRLTNDGVYIDGGRAQNVIVRMKASESGALQVYWGTDPGGLTGDNVVATAYTTPGEWVIKNLQVGTHEKWRGYPISSLRIDPISVSGATFAIDWIAISDGDFDRDGLLDVEEGFSDTNGDGSPNAMDVDSDGDGVTDDREGVTARDRLEPSDMYFGGAARIEGSFEGWMPISVTSFTSGGSVFLSGTSSTNDPQLRRTGFFFSGSEASQIKVSFRAPEAGSIQLYWGIDGDDTYRTSRAMSSSYTTPGQWQTLTFDLSSKAEWTAETVTSIRIDPGTVAGKPFEIYSISAAP